MRLIRRATGRRVDKLLSGGCLTYAAALRDLLPRGAKLRDVVALDRPHHVVVEYKGTFHDAAGSYSSFEEVIEALRARGAPQSMEFRLEPHSRQRAKEVGLTVNHRRFPSARRQAERAAGQQREPKGQCARGPRLPTQEMLRPFIARGECYLHAEAVAKRLGLQYASGFFLAPIGRGVDHAWVVAPDGTIIDTTFGQFNPRIPLGIFPVGAPEHARYFSWSRHHNPDCLHKLVRLPYPCEVCGACVLPPSLRGHQAVVSGRAAQGPPHDGEAKPCWWLNWNAESALRTFVQRTAPEAKHGLACGLSAIWWADVLADAGFTVTLIDGEYAGEGHSWLEVDGVLFDPTAAQFDDFPEMDESVYTEHIREDRRHKWY